VPALPDEARLLAAFAIAGCMTAASIPLAIGLARRTDFYDLPVGYKEHSGPTPYLGGAALVAGFALSSLWIGRSLDGVIALVACATALFAVGTTDDRIAVRPLVRLVVELGVGAIVFAAGLGWSVFGSEGVNLILTMVFVLGLINAYNLMDNLDGAAATVGCVSAAGVGTLAAIEGDAALGAIMLALAGSCAGFLPFNLARPSRIFLGDGGSMPLGLVVAAGTMSLPNAGAMGWAVIPLAVVLVGLPAFDTMLVIVSRLRRGAPVYKGARDHLTHRLLVREGTVWRVALTLAGIQAALVVAGGALWRADSGTAGTVAIAFIVIGIALVAALESPWRPAAAQTSSA
jgi:UDP-GlcNAc:undecaprenyl-phosphate GlcNAc-1-phosphate transferase